VEFLLDGLRQAAALVARGDPEIFHAIYVSLLCSILAVSLAAILAIPYGIWLGFNRREGQGVQVFLMRVGMFTPTVVVGLLVYGLLSRRGILGSLDLLYTKGAIVIGEFLLALPLMVVMTHGAAAAIDQRVLETARTFGAGHVRTLLLITGEMRVALVSVYLAGLARCFSELGVVMAVGGNFRLRTRTLSSTISLELQKGEFDTALACGIILMILACGAALLAHRLAREHRP
jgi:tungstate transport system permease protein